MGLNVKKGQTVFIQAGLDQPEFVTMVVEECYKAGAKAVYVEWSHQPVGKLNAEYKSLETLSALTPWDKAKWEYKASDLSCRLFIESEDPDGMNGIDQEKMSRARRAQYPQLKRKRWRRCGRSFFIRRARTGKIPSRIGRRTMPTSKAAVLISTVWGLNIFDIKALTEPICKWS